MKLTTKADKSSGSLNRKMTKELMTKAAKIHVCPAFSNTSVRHGYFSPCIIYVFYFIGVKVCL